MNEKTLSWIDFYNSLPDAVCDDEIEQEWIAAVDSINGKIIVLDDDPTGVQTVHSVPVYTSWGTDSLKSVMNEKCRVVYILTNSRALTANETEKLHCEIARGLIHAAREAREEFLLISRSDSTLRGHFPIETKILAEELGSEKEIDGEIIIPFFKEGGRFTHGDVHYIKDNEILVPSSQTEFAKDTTFGYKSSNLKEWVEEKTRGAFPAANVISISLDLLRNRDINGIVDKLIDVKGFNKVIVNAVEYSDLKVFCICLARVLSMGKRFLFRTAASFVQVIGGITPKQLLDRRCLYPEGKASVPGLLIVGSFVQKTTMQLKKLHELSNIDWIEFDVREVENDEKQNMQVDKTILSIEKSFSEGRDVCVYTSREYYLSDVRNVQSEKNLAFSMHVSDSLVKVIQGLNMRPGFIIAKGGITSSDIGVKGLNVKRAVVMGQIQPGIPVWELGPESRFPGLPYIIFPGNVGEVDTLGKVLNMVR